ncbi:hypothetical protein QWZ13_14405 [Reinekea marina]|uniref:hypothetical protein n=1 Tax=Reinekea marina TaxID=1310421 RepID=UPI0025B3BEA6|nr:hypothetical protein [Reinekea marina]MDN3650108.1 hypothetical protein [Reinekea marina]
MCPFNFKIQQCEVIKDDWTRHGNGTISGRRPPVRAKLTACAAKTKVTRLNAYCALVVIRIVNFYRAHCRYAVSGC